MRDDASFIREIERLGFSEVDLIHREIGVALSFRNGSRRCRHMVRTGVAEPLGKLMDWAREQ